MYLYQYIYIYSLSYFLSTYFLSSTDSITNFQHISWIIVVSVFRICAGYLFRLNFGILVQHHSKYKSHSFGKNLFNICGWIFAEIIEEKRDIFWEHFISCQIFTVIVFVNGTEICFISNFSSVHKNNYTVIYIETFLNKPFYSRWLS